MVDSNNGLYETKNTALAAYLRIEGFTLVDVSIDNFPSVFIFENCPKITECEHLWQLNQAIGNLSDFFESYRLCLRMTKVGKL